MSKFVAIKSKLTLVLAGLAAAGAVAASAIVAGVSVNSSASPSALTVVIDAGHGGIDNGVAGVNTGAMESELNLSVAKFLREDFRQAGFKVVMTRTTSAGLYGNAKSSLKRADMKGRKKIIQSASPDLVISIHMNKCPLPSRRGAQVFYKGEEQSQIFARCVQRSLDGMEESVRECPTLKGDYYVLNVSECPSVLVECGFLSNEEDEALLVTEEYRKKLAQAVFKGAVDFLFKQTSASFVGVYVE